MNTRAGRDAPDMHNPPPAKALRFDGIVERLAHRLSVAELRCAEFSLKREGRVSRKTRSAALDVSNHALEPSAGDVASPSVVCCETLALSPAIAIIRDAIAALGAQDLGKPRDMARTLQALSWRVAHLEAAPMACARAASCARGVAHSPCAGSSAG